ncbi:MAG: hypothetical protein KBD15_01455 [Candidatus Magasanikbacteria bacterium]|jgi:hypothetical protein|nr:hypothetical protein [Candidatus Magasanikbacteria bacterium]
MALLLIQRLVLEFFFDILYAPVWWYSVGAKQVLIALLRTAKHASLRLAPMLWLKNIFVPMFGQTDWQGRMVSFFMRLVNVIGRSFALVIVSVLLLGVFLFWVAVPISIGMFLVQSLFA